MKSRKAQKICLNNFASFYFREAMKKLINVGRAFDSITNVGREGTYELVRRM